MQIVSDAWKAAHTERLLDENYLEIAIEIGDPEAVQDGTASANGSDELANTASISSGISLDPEKYALLDWNAWTLDGTYEVIPDGHPDDTGYIGNTISEKNGVFAVSPVVTISFTQTFERLIPGITITWSEEYDEYPRSFKIAAYNGTSIVAQTTVTQNTSAVTPVNLDISNYNRIEITVYDWCLPLHRARISEVFVGLKKLYRKSEIMSYNNNVSIAPLSENLPRHEIDFEVSNINGDYDPNNPDSMTKYLMERQAVSVRYGMRAGGKPEYISGGRYYLNEWESPQNGITAKFRARGAIEYLQDTYLHGLYQAAGTTLYELAESVLSEAGLPRMWDGSDPWEIDDSLKSITTTAALPICTRAECLQLIANAARCVLTINRSGKIVIAPMKTAASDYAVSAFNSYSKPELKLSKQLKNVKVDVFSYYTGDSGVKLFEGDIPIDGTQTIVLQYNESASGVSASVTGGTLGAAKYFTNSCELTITASGTVNVVLSGTQLKSSVRTYSLMVGEEGETEELSNPLITSSEMAAPIAEHIKNVLINRRTFEMDWRADTRLDAGDVIRVDNKFGSEAAYVTKLKYHFAGGFRATGEARATT